MDASEQVKPADEGRLEREVKRLVEAGFDTGMLTADERHERVVSFFPGGMNSIQFAAATIMSADSEGIVDPPSIGTWWEKQSLTMSLWMVEGLIERRCRRDEAGPYYLTRKALAMRPPLNVEVSRQGGRDDE